jgi:hypothetical protein
MAMEKRVHLKKIAAHVFHNPLRPIPNLTTCPSSPAAGEPISAATLLNLLRERRVMRQDVNVGHDKTDKRVRRELPSVRLKDHCIKRVVRGSVLMSMEKKKMMKKQRRGVKKKGASV